MYAKSIKSAAVATLIGLMFSCGGNKSNTNNDDVVSAIQDQNKILQSQSNQTISTISITGSVHNLATDTRASNATVKIKIGTAFSDPVTVNNGSFQIDKLAPNSNFVLVIHSTNNSFLDRTVFGKTQNVSGESVNYQDVGAIDVAPGVTHTFSVIDSITKQPIPNLNLSANSNTGVSSDADLYLHKAIYDSSTKSYSVITPDLITDTLRASLDLDHDGKADYTPKNNTQLLYPSDLFFDVGSLNSQLIELVVANQNAPVQIRLSILGSKLESLVAAKPGLSDALNGDVQATYDAATNQFVINGKMNTDLTIFVPSFSVGGIYYSSSTLSLHQVDPLHFTAGSSYPFSSYQFAFNNTSDPKVFDIAFKPGLLTPSSNLSLIAMTPADLASQSISVFYSNPIALLSSSVSFTKKTLQVVKGDADVNDSVPLGYTSVSLIDTPVDTTVTQKLDNTLLVVTPTTTLTPGNYTFNVLNVTDLASSLSPLSVDVYGDSLTILQKNTANFLITDVILDNQNYTTNGSAIVAQNTAGITSTISNSSHNTSLLLPTTIENLKNLTFYKQQVTTGPTITFSSGTFKAVENGVVNATANYAVQSAYNETIVTNGGSYLFPLLGTTVANGSIYTMDINQWLGDDLPSNANSITFAYTFETLNGTVSAGTITLSVK